jgi:polysaccharide deacetylase family protein (PEP-CTERM system associated)
MQLNELIAPKEREMSLPSRPVQMGIALRNGMSIDVEDYFQTQAMTSAVPRREWDKMPSRVVGNTERLFELFAAHGVRATFFFLGWIAHRYPGLVRKAKELGHEIGCHSYWHRPIYTLSPAQFLADTVQAKAAIEDATGARIFGYRAPSFSLTPGTEWAVDILAEAGFRYDSSVHPIAHDLYENRSAPRHPYRFAGASLVEIPISTVRFGNKNLPFSGGGYFRMFPYAYVRWAMRTINRVEKRSTVFYLHPWEIDPTQPRLIAARKSRIRQYTGLDKTLGQLDRLLRDFRFSRLDEVFPEAGPIT